MAKTKEELLKEREEWESKKFANMMDERMDFNFDRKCDENIAKINTEINSLEQEEK